VTRRGFTLLEVLVAISILGLGLTVILSSQTGLFASTRHAENLTHATFLARCKMSETELQLLQEGYPLIDQAETGACCEDDDSDFSCDWKVELVELPFPGSFDETDLDASDGVPTLGGDAGPGLASGIPGDVGDLSALGAISGLQDPKGGGEALGAMAALGGGEAGGGIGAMVMALVYPDLKPMLESSIRKVTVTVKWQEYGTEKDFSVTQYVTDPQEGGLLLEAPEAEDPSGEDQAGLPTPSPRGGILPGGSQ
jgi:general secretion pathway protein I